MSAWQLGPGLRRGGVVGRNWRKLVPHPDRPCPEVEAVHAVVSRQPGNAISVRFVVIGDLRFVQLPELEHPADQRRRDELWQTTCFEAFVRPAGGEAYFELNVAPTGHWAAYRFDRYREGMVDAAADRQQFRADPSRRDWYDTSFVTRLPEAQDGVPWSVGLSAVLATLDGTKSYWALAHATGPPDFHNPACFTARLPAPDAA